MILGMMEKGVMKNIPITAMEEFEEIEEIMPIQESCESYKSYKVMKPERDKETPLLEDEKVLDDVNVDVDGMIEEKIKSKNQGKEVAKQGHSEIKTKEKKPTSSQPQGNDGKYKWSGKWPRQLGKKND